MSDTPMSAREYFLQLTDPTNWHAGAGQEWAEAMSFVHEGVMEFWDELEENRGSPSALQLQSAAAALLEISNLDPYENSLSVAIKIASNALSQLEQDKP